MGNTPILSIITVTWNSAEFIADQIQSVKKACKNISYEHFIIDNASTDETVEIIEKITAQSSPVETQLIASLPRGRIFLIKNSSNLGFAAANNLVAKQAQGRFLLFLNPDMRLEERSLDTMVEWMEKHQNVGISGCKLTNQDGQTNHDLLPRRFPTFSDQAVLMLKLSKIFPRPMERYLMKGFDAEKEQIVDSVRGSCMLMRRELFEKTGWAFDPRYFIWFEDVDICKEAYRHGFEVVYTPVISVIDYFGRSFKKNTDVWWKRKNFTKSMLAYFKKWEPWYVWMSLCVVRSFGMMVAYIREVLR